MSDEINTLVKAEPGHLEPRTSERHPQPGPPSIVKSLKSDALILSILASLIANIIWWFAGSALWPIGIFWLPLLCVAIYHRFEARKLETKWNELHQEVERLREWKSIAGTTGLVGCVTALQRSTYHPRACMETEVDVWLDFMGHGASKWTKERELLDKMLRRIYEGGGRARFLLLDPESEACKEISRVHYRDENNDTKMIVQSLMVFKPLKKTYGEILQIKVYNHRPQLRLTFIDHFKVVVGHYRANRNDSKESPLHVYTSANAEWSFYTAYHIHFEDEWKNAREIDWDEIERLYARFSDSH